jgi:hypothetical protein
MAFGGSITAAVCGLAMAAPATPVAGPESTPGFAIGDMPDVNAAEWIAPPPPPPPPPPPTTSAVPSLPSTSLLSPTVTTTRPFDPSTPVVTTHRDPKLRWLTTRERKLVYVALGLDAVSMIPFGFMVDSAVKFDRARDRFDAQRKDDPNGPFPEDLAREALHHRDIVIGTSITVVVLATAAGVLYFLATRRHRRDGPRRSISRVALGRGGGA